LPDKAPLTSRFTTSEVNDSIGPDSALASCVVKLIDPIVYRIRKKQFNFIARSATVSDAIRFALMELGVRTVFMVPPDNNKTYTNFIVPPAHDISSFINYLQNAPRYGVYFRGISYYYSNGTMYVYPMHDTEPEHGFTTHLYNAGTRDLLGLPRYHRYDNSMNLHVLVPGDIDHDAIAQREIENSASGRILYSTADIPFNWSETSSTGRTTIKEHYGTLRRDRNIGIVDMMDMAAAKIQPSDANPYAHGSEVAASFRNVMACTWMNALPFAIKPGHAIKFHHDVPNATDVTDRVPVNVTQSGTIEKCVYELKLVDATPPRVFGCDGHLQIAINPSYQY
jgi:hypothetical protein